jgi:hypothetical protein
MSDFAFDLTKPLASPAKVPEPERPRIRSSKEAEWDGAATILQDPKSFGQLETEAGLLHLPDFNWMRGSWTLLKKQDGWRDELTGRFVSTAQVNEAIERRIRELGLDRDLLTEWMKAGPHHAADRAWEAQPFEIRMQTFRRGA